MLSVSVPTRFAEIVLRSTCKNKTVSELRRGSRAEGSELCMFKEPIHSIIGKRTLIGGGGMDVVS